MVGWVMTAHHVLRPDTTGFPVASRAREEFGPEARAGPPEGGAGSDWVGGSVGMSVGVAVGDAVGAAEGISVKTVGELVGAAVGTGVVAVDCGVGGIDGGVDGGALVMIVAARRSGCVWCFFGAVVS